MNETALCEFVMWVTFCHWLYILEWPQQLPSYEQTAQVLNLVCGDFDCGHLSKNTVIHPTLIYHSTFTSQG